MHILLALVLTVSHALAGDTATFRGKPEGAGLFTRGTITLNESSIVCETRGIFREDTYGFKYTDIDTFSSSIGLFRGHIVLTMTDGKTVTFSAPRSSARSMKRVLAERLARGGNTTLVPVVVE